MFKLMYIKETCDNMLKIDFTANQIQVMIRKHIASAATVMALAGNAWK